MIMSGETRFVGQRVRNGPGAGEQPGPSGMCRRGCATPKSNDQRRERFPLFSAPADFSWHLFVPCRLGAPWWLETSLVNSALNSTRLAA